MFPISVFLVHEQVLYSFMYNFFHTVPMFLVDCGSKFPMFIDFYVLSPDVLLFLSLKN